MDRVAVSISQQTKESIADALAVAIQDAAVVVCRHSSLKDPTHYSFIITPDGRVEFRFATRNLGQGWIPLDE